MKKKRSLLSVRIIAMITAVMLTGCSETIGSRENDVTSEAPKEQTVTVTEETASAAASAAIEEEPTSDDDRAASPTPPEEPDPTAAVYAAARHLDKLRLVPASKQGVYKLGGMLEKEPELEYHHGTVVAFEYVKADEEEADAEKETEGIALENYTIRVYDMQSSLILGETDSVTTGYFPYNWETCGSIDGGYYSCFGNKMRIMDIGMNVRSEFELPVGSCTRVWVSDSGRFVLCNSRRGPSVLFDAETRTEVKMTRNVKAVSVLRHSGDTFEIINTKGERFTITGGGEVTSLGVLEVPDYYYESLGELSGRVIDLVPAGMTVRDPVGGIAKLVDKLPEKINYIIAASERYVTYCDKKYRARVIDLETGMVSEAIGKGEYAVRGTSSDDDFIFWNGSRYCLAVPSELNFGETVGLTDLSLKTEEYLMYFKTPKPDSDSSAKLLDELLTKYNVRVMFAPVSEDERYCGYYCKTYGGSQTEILTGLRDFLALSPPGILTEAAKFGSETWILICSSIVDDPELSSYGAAGFTAEIGLHPFVALETPLDEKQTKAASYLTEEELYEQFTTYITNNLSHEFIHVLDGKTTDEQLEEWDSLSPKDAYYGNYSSNGDEQYIYPTADFDDEVYFTDVYGRVNELEDKARIGENLYYAQQKEKKSAREKFARSKSLYKKAVKLCEILRENYPCLSEIPKGEWYLEKPLLGSYDEMKKAYIAEKDSE